jgi:hypothetical protein
MNVYGRALTPAFILSATVVFGQTEEGKADKYFDFDEKEGVKLEYPALSIEQLRRICLYSKLDIKGSQLQVADDKYMHRIEPHQRDKELLVVTSDHFRFTVLKNGVIDPKLLSAESRKRYQFLWIKHATKESPDGKPWLKDLVLLPYDPKTRKLLNPWPFSRIVDKTVVGSQAYRWPSFLAAADARPGRGKFPDETKSVIGTFQSGRVHYLVIDVFGGYSWWGKVAASEFIALRNVSPLEMELFHKAAKGTAAPQWAAVPWKNPRVRLQHEMLATNREKALALARKLPAVLDIPVRSEKTEGWEDLLLLDAENQPVKALDDQLQNVKTFGDLIVWASDYMDSRLGPAYFQHWFKPLSDRLAEDERSHLVAIRALRYACRRMGFPAQIICLPEKAPLYPRVYMHVFIPSQKVSWVLLPGPKMHSICEPESPVLYTLPTVTQSFRGKIPVFDSHLGGGELAGNPVPY